MVIKRIYKKLSLNPHLVVKKIYLKLKILDSINTKAVNELTKVSFTSNKIKDVKRGSRKELNSWKGKLTIKEMDFIKARTELIYNELDNLSI